MKKSLWHVYLNLKVRIQPHGLQGNDSLFPFQLSADYPFEGFDHFRIELSPTFRYEFVQRFPRGHALAVGTVGRHCIKSIRYSNNTSP